MMEHIQVIGVQGLPLIKAGDNIAALICERIPVQDGDIISIASTIHSKAKGYTKALSSFTPSERALRLAKLNGEDPRFVQAVLDASSDIIMEHPFILSELSFGHIGVRAGVDQSNIEDGMVIFLPPDPMAAASEFKNEIKKISGKRSVFTGPIVAFVLISLIGIRDIFWLALIPGFLALLAVLIVHLGVLVEASRVHRGEHGLDS